MSKKHLYLHIGTEKTGTTNIQQTLFHNYNRLKGMGILYPKAFMTGHSHAAFTASLLGEEGLSVLAQHLGSHEDLLRKNPHYFLDRLDEEINASGCGTVIISSELLHSRITEDADVERIKRWTEERFDEVYVVCYLRKQIDLVISGYSTKIKEGGTPGSTLSEAFSAALVHLSNSNDIPHYFNYRKMLDMWSKHFPNMVCREFSRNELKDGDAVLDFLSLLEPHIDSSQLQIAEERNSSLDGKAMEFLALVNKKIPAIVDDKPNPIRRNLVSSFENIPRKTKILPNREDAVNLQNYFNTDNQYISDTYFNGKALFQDEIKFDKEYHDGLTTDESIEIFTNIWNQTAEYMNRLDAENKYLKAKLAYKSNNYDLAASMIKQSLITGVRLPQAVEMIEKIKKHRL